MAFSFPLFPSSRYTKDRREVGDQTSAGSTRRTVDGADPEPFSFFPPSLSLFLFPRRRSFKLKERPQAPASILPPSLHRPEKQMDFSLLSLPPPFPLIIAQRLRRPACVLCPLIQKAELLSPHSSFLRSSGPPIPTRDFFFSRGPIPSLFLIFLAGERRKPSPQTRFSPLFPFLDAIQQES